MSVAAFPNPNETWIKPHTSVCYDNNRVNSQGIFLGEQPLMYSLPIFLLEISILFLSSSAIHFLLKPISQSRFTSQLIAGIILGPVIISRSPKLQETLFPDRATFILDTISFLSLMFFMFTTSVKVDFSLFQKPGKLAILISITIFVLPVSLVLAYFFLLRSSFPANLRDGSLIFNVTFIFSLTFFPVVSDVLDELRLLNTELGRIALSCTLITDVACQVMIAGLFAYNSIIKTKTLGMAVGMVLSLIVFVFFIIFFAKPAILWVAKRTPSGEMLKEEYFVGLIVVTIIMGLMTDIIGYHLLMGPFLFGLVSPCGMPVGVTLSERLEPLFVGLLLPTYMVLAGYRTDFSSMIGMPGWGVLEVVFALCFVGKFVGCVGVALYYKMPIREAASLALILNVKGIAEISFVNMWADTRIASASQFSLFTISMLISTFLTTPLISYLYNPSSHYLTKKRRNIQHLKRQSPLPLLIVVYNEDNVAGLLDILEASVVSSPLSLTLLHLTQLAGHRVATLRPYVVSQRSTEQPTASDRIINAFRYFEQQVVNSTVTLAPYIANSPPLTMHNDVCSLALECNSRLIILPFHKQSNGAQQINNHTLQFINRNVLNYAPCSVAILIEHGLHVGATCAHTNILLQRIVVLFFGSADDREALSYASRMAESPAIALTVVRFLPRDREVITNTVEWNLDEVLLDEFRERHAGNEKVLYIEKVVEDGEGTAEVIQGMSGSFDLLIVGRRKGVDSVLTSGLSEWSECPELGVVGDMVASTEVHGKMSVLVVQQQVRLAREDNNGGSDAGSVEMMRSNEQND